jgi:hypothetical protein
MFLVSVIRHLTHNQILKSNLHIYQMLKAVLMISACSFACIFE